MLDILKAIESIAKIFDWITNRKDEKYPSNKVIATKLSKNIGDLIERFEKVTEEMLTTLFYEKRNEDGSITYPNRVKIGSLNRNLLKNFREMQIIYWDLETTIYEKVDSAPLRNFLEACGQIVLGESNILLVAEAQKRAIDTGYHDVYYKAESHNAVTAQYFDNILRELTELRYKLRQLERMM